MTPNQKAAWTNLVIIGATLVVFLLTVAVMAWHFQQPWTRVVHPAMGAFGLIGLSGLCSLYYRPLRRPRPLMDERDRLIEQQSHLIGYSVFWGVWVVASVGGWALLIQLGYKMIPVGILPMSLVLGFMVLTLAQSIATLVQYGRREQQG